MKTIIITKKKEFKKILSTFSFKINHKNMEPYLKSKINRTKMPVLKYFGKFTKFDDIQIIIMLSFSTC